MAGSVNKVILVGNLGKDPEIRTTQDGQKIVNLTLATSDTWNDRQSGERKERTEWHQVVLFGKMAETCEKYLAKGRLVYVEGRLRTREYAAKNNGGKRQRTAARWQAEAAVVQGFDQRRQKWRRRRDGENARGHVGSAENCGGNLAEIRPSPRAPLAC